MASRFLYDPKYALMYGLLALLLLLSGALLFREAGQLRERAEGMAAENQLLLSYRHAERDAAHLDLLSSLFQKAPARPMGSCSRRQASPWKRSQRKRMEILIKFM